MEFYKDKVIAGYEITDHISLEGKHFVLGHNPKNAAPYAVWESTKDMDLFFFGRYFAHKHAAIADMVVRATVELQRPDGIPLSVDFLAENAREALQLQMIEEKAKEVIRETLADALAGDVYDTELSAEQILDNPDFCSLALKGYYNIDHSEENFYLHHIVTDILESNPQFLKPEPSKGSLDEIIQAAQNRQPMASQSFQQAEPER